MLFINSTYTELKLRKVPRIRKGKFLLILLGNFGELGNLIFGGNSPEVRVYKSLSKGSVHQVFSHQILDIVKNSTDNIQVDYTPSLKTKEIIAIPFAVALEFDDNIKKRNHKKIFDVILVSV